MTARRVEHVHLVRHGLPVEVTDTADPDPDLSGYGRRQAEAVATWWDGRTVSGVLTSQLARARQTADPLLRSLGAGSQEDPGLAEFEIGADFYLPITDLHLAGEHPKIAWWRARLGDPGIQRARAAFHSEAVAAFERVTDVTGTDPLLVFTHGGFVAAVVSHALGLPAAVALDADYASITTLRRTPRGGWTVVSFSETQHLAPLGAPRQARGISLET
ncbi:histidine phosphatase family protein [Nocardioides marmoriginsengisoli]|uniref:Histidine phosphatase family protein n=1 Tax=Nocardioides marmoriginsengisoli TaxID=661483 RepID=A0A3N0CGD4_9ACTN|nr:histidine phosphatase family protein [Nocardioides marmoriginsengisoli]RNL62369.1 histidine phosphatase family protein [Nocardioides marmoriginsengisoli]